MVVALRVLPYANACVVCVYGSRSLVRVFVLLSRTRATMWNDGMGLDFPVPAHFLFAPKWETVMVVVVEKYWEQGTVKAGKVSCSRP